MQTADLLSNEPILVSDQAPSMCGNGARLREFLFKAK
jgi:hypothetical protein